MSQEDDDLDLDLDDNEDGQGEQRTNAEWAAKRRSDNAARKAAQERDAAKRELAFVRSGLDPEKDPRLAYFIKGYEGEATPDAIRAAAIAAGFVEAPPTGPTEQQQETLATNSRIDQAGAAGDPGYAGPEAAALEKMDQAYLSGGATGVLAVLAEMGVLQVTD